MLYTAPHRSWGHNEIKYCKTCAREDVTSAKRFETTLSVDSYAAPRIWKQKENVVYRLLIQVSFVFHMVVKMQTVDDKVVSIVNSSWFLKIILVWWMRLAPSVDNRP